MEAQGCIGKNLPWAFFMEDFNLSKVENMEKDIDVKEENGCYLQLLQFGDFLKTQKEETQNTSSIQELRYLLDFGRRESIQI